MKLSCSDAFSVTRHTGVSIMAQQQLPCTPKTAVPWQHVGLLASLCHLCKLFDGACVAYRRPGDSRWSMAASAFHYVWPTTGILRARLAACFVLITAERAINLAAPVAFKHMVELLGNVTAAAATAAAAHPEAGPITLLQMALRSLLVSAQATDGSAQLHAAGGMAAVANTTVSAAAGTTAAGGMEFLAPFWTLFYPWALIYLGAFFLRGGSGSEGLLANIRDILYIPITQVGMRMPITQGYPVHQHHLATPVADCHSINCIILLSKLSLYVM